MKKVGGILLLILGCLLLILSAFHAFNILSSLLSSGGGNSSYAIGHLFGSVLGLLLFIVLGYKAIIKGKALVKATN